MPCQNCVQSSFQNALRMLLSGSMLLLSVLYSHQAKALPEQPEYLVKSAMIFRMLQYTTWPEEDKLSAIRLAFVGDEEKLYEEMQRASKNIQVKGKPLIVFRTDIDSIDPQINQVVYLDNQHSQELHGIANLTRRTGTLLLTNQATDRHELMINFLSVQGKALSFEVNRSNIVFEKLEIASDLLLLGGTEIDVAELFRETEQALMVIKQELFEREAKLKQTNEILSQEQQEVQRQKTLVEGFRNEVKAREQALLQRANELDDLNGNIKQVNVELANKQRELAEREKRYNEQLNRLRDQSVNIAFLNEQIMEKQTVLAQQEERLQSLAGENNAQQGELSYQQQTLKWVFGALALFALLVIYTLWISAARKRVNRQLAAFQANMVTLGGIGRDLTAHLDLNQVLDKLYADVNELFDAHVFMVGILDNENHCIDMALAVEQKRRIPPFRLSLSDDNQPEVQCIKQNREVIIQHAQTAPEQTPKPPLGEAMKTQVFLPLIIQDKLVGCLSIQSPEQDAYSEEQLEMMRLLSRYIAIAVSNALGYAQLQQQKRKTQLQSSQVQAVQKQLMQSEKLATLGVLTPKVAKELNDPANAAHTASFLMVKEIDKIKAFLTQLAGGEAADAQVLQAFESNFAQLLELCEDAGQASGQIKNIIDHIRAYANLDNDNSSQPLPQLVDSTMALLKSHHNKIQLQADGHQQLEDIKLPGKLSQVFMNLLVNACQAIEKRQTQEPQLDGEVKLQVQSVNGQLTIDISDNGIGMTSTTRDKLFDPFYTTSQDGTGLGLTISNQIVQELGGSMSVSQTGDNGSVLTLSFPL